MRNSKWDIVLIALSMTHGVVLLAAPSIPVIALGVWWNSNTISHNFIHLPFFRSHGMNRLYSMYLSVLLGIPQSLWRRRHMSHHGTQTRNMSEVPSFRRRGGCAEGADGVVKLLGVASEVGLVVLLWASFLGIAPHFFLLTYLPGYLTGLALCYIHGHFEHIRGAISNYGVFYNRAFFNDGYHVEHHLRPGEHWTRLPRLTRPGTTVSRWPAIIRWIEIFNLEFLENVALRSRIIQRFLLKTHEQAFRALLPKLGRLHHIKIVGGGMFPRTALILQKLLPETHLTIVDASARNLETAKKFLNGAVEFENATYDPDKPDDADLVVIPLAFIGDRAKVYAGRSQTTTIIHDWIWSNQVHGVPISFLLLKRLNLVES